MSHYETVMTFAICKLPLRKHQQISLTFIYISPLLWIGLVTFHLAMENIYIIKEKWWNGTLLQSKTMWPFARIKEECSTTHSVNEPLKCHSKRWPLWRKCVFQWLSDSQMDKFKTRSWKCTMWIHHRNKWVSLYCYTLHHALQYIRPITLIKP